MTNFRDDRFPRCRYYGEVRLQNLVSNARLQEFAQQVSLICCLEADGKISRHQAYKNLSGLWSKLTQNREQFLDE